MIDIYKYTYFFFACLVFRIEEKRIFTRTDHIIPRQILKLISLEYELRSKR